MRDVQVVVNDDPPPRLTGWMRFWAWLGRHRIATALVILAILVVPGLLKMSLILGAIAAGAAAIVLWTQRLHKDSPELPVDTNELLRTCIHPKAVPVRDSTGTVVSWLCRSCDAQLPASSSVYTD